MPSRSRLSPLFTVRMYVHARLPAYWLCALTALLLSTARVTAAQGAAFDVAAAQSAAFEPADQSAPMPFLTDPVQSGAPSALRPYGSYVIVLEEEPVAAVYAAAMAEEQVQSASVTAATQAQLARVEAAQAQLVATLDGYDAQIIYRVQRVLNGVAVYLPQDEVAAIAALPGVQAVYPLFPKQPANARTDTLLNAPAIWQGIDRAGLTGKGVTIAIIDTGIDYLHTMFGGPGTGYQDNDSSVIGDVPNFPGAKVIGGYDFAGNNYDASPTSLSYNPVPAPDPDPMDCYSFGHGTHVSGTAAGYGVQLDGSTYRGPYDSTIGLASLRIGPGLAPEASIYALKVFGCTGSSNVVDAAIEWAVDPNQDGDFSDHVDVINLSLGSGFGAAYDVTTMAVENAAQLGVIVVASAGNTGDVHYAVGSPGVATRAISVAATSINSSEPGTFQDGTVASFSARGPGRAENYLKPDIAAPGVNVVSARRGTGTLSVTSSGTSMASPVVAGVMALLRQAHPAAGLPGWRSRELKALAMNTAVYPFVRPDLLVPYSLLRVGAGRIDPTTALQSLLIAYDADAPERVSVNFGVVEVLDHTTVVRHVRLANKGDVPIAVTVGYTRVRELPGVSIDVDVSKTITVPAFGYAATAVTLTVDAATLARRPDPTRLVTPLDSQPWVDEASGYISFSPVITAPQVISGSPAIHVPVLAMPRLVSALSALHSPIDLAHSITRTTTITVVGSVDTGGAISGLVPPTRTVPMVGVFGLALSSPPITSTSTGDPTLGRFRQGDLRYVGTAGPFVVEGKRMLYFALVSYEAWSSPLGVTYQIAIDTNEDNIADFQLRNLEATDISLFDFATTDDFVSLLERINSTRTVQGMLNVYPATQFDTRPFNNTVMVLPLQLDELGADVASFRYQITSTSRDLSDTLTSGYIEVTPILTLALDKGAGIDTGMGAPLFPVAAGEAIDLTFHRAAYTQQHSQGVLLIYPQNGAGERTQVLPVQFARDHTTYLPRIRQD